MSRSLGKNRLKVEHALLTKQIPEESSLYVFSLLPVCCGKQNRKFTGQDLFNHIQITQKKIMISNAFSVKKKSTSPLLSLETHSSRLLRPFLVKLEHIRNTGYIVCP